MVNKVPKPGEHRVVKRFALFPIWCQSGEWAWLEWVNVEQMYTQYWQGVRLSNGWVDMRFVK